MKTHSLILFVILFSTTSFSCEMVVFGNNSKPPKNYNDHSGHPKGILVEMMYQLEKPLRCTFHIVLYPWKRAYHQAANGEGAIIGLSKTTERLEVFDYSDVMYYETLVLVTRSDRTFSFGNVNDLKGKTLGIVRGASYGDEFEEATHSGLFKIIELSSPSQRLKMLIRGRIDAVLMGGPGREALDRVLQRDSYLEQYQDKFTVLPQPFKEDPNYLGLAKKPGNKAFLKRFNQALQQARSNDTFNKIIRKYQNSSH
ncbi:substrate-binding periplasmic protein [Dongshaea marina]|uniref:substrate-binding periplasmic protein n=1 Tax=Dongshaea marina TaxID=2047966 RepID=UPI00131F1567|nr:transporter substrate-binding domain-containing protein [Dongshaea marina]